MNLSDTELKVNENFLIQRCSFKNQPLQKERKLHRQIYKSLLYQWLMKITDDQDLITYFMKKLDVDLQFVSDDIPKKPVDFSKGIKQISNIFWHGGFSFGKHNYQYLCILECICLAGIIKGYNQEKMDKMLSDFCKQCVIDEDCQRSLKQYMDSLFVKAVQKDGSEVSELFQNQDDTTLQQTFHYIDQHYRELYEYRQRPRYHIAVCATMSSGKSTFINALLGGYYIPSGNEACTAKITSISDNDKFPELVGCYAKGENLCEYRDAIDNKVLDQWNSDEAITHVFLEGDLQQIGSDHVVLVIHDTPGTNSSQNPIHHKRTMEFLQEQPLQAIIYLLNAEHISTTDNQRLLKEIKQKVIDQRKTKIVFLINKIDSFDEEEGDDIQKSVDSVCQELAKVGFKNPIVIPVIAYGASLFKRALSGQADKFTRKERLDFMSLYSLCMEENLDVTTYQRNVSVDVRVPRMEGKVLIKDKSYDKSDLIEALRRTGIYTIASLIDHALKTYQGEISSVTDEEKPMPQPVLDRVSQEDIVQGNPIERRDASKQSELQELYADLDAWGYQNNKIYDSRIFEKNHSQQ